MIALVGPLFLLLCIPSFVQAANLLKAKSEFQDLDPNANLQTIIKALDEMPAEEIQNKIDTFPELEKYIRRFNRESLSAVVIRVPNLDYNLFQLQLSTVRFIYRQVDDETRRYIYAAAPRTMLKLEKSMADVEGSMDKENESEKKWPNEEASAEGESEPHESDERNPEEQDQTHDGEEEPCPQYPSEQYSPWVESPVQDAYADYQCPYEEQPRYGFFQMREIPYQDYPHWRIMPFPPHLREQPPIWLEPREPPYGFDEPVLIRRPYAYYQRPFEEESPYGFYEIGPIPHYGRPFSLYSPYILPSWPEVRQRPFGIIMRPPIHYPYADYQWAFEGPPRYVFFEGEPSFQYPHEGSSNSSEMH
ncbi:hypothetical protein Aperf_G00000095904 [Anoplocephala perfoliata]